MLSPGAPLVHVFVEGLGRGEVALDGLEHGRYGLRNDALRTTPTAILASSEHAALITFDTVIVHLVFILDVLFLDEKPFVTHPAFFKTV